MADRVERWIFEADASELEAATKLITKQLRKLEKEAEGAGDAVGGVGSKSTKSASQLEALKFAAQGTGGAVGEMAGRIENAGRALGIFATNPVALATASVTALSVAAVASGVAVAGAFVGIVRAAEEAQSALAPLGEAGLGLDDEDAEALDRAAKALDAVSLVAQQLVAELGTELAPIVEEVSVLMLAMGLQAVDTFNALAEGADLGREVLARMLEFGLNPMNATLLTLTEGVAAFARAMGDPIETLEEWNEIQRDNQRGATLFAGSLDLITLSLGDNVEKAREMIDTLVILDKTFEEIEFKQTADDIEDVNAQWEMMADAATHAGESMQSAFFAPFNEGIQDADEALAKMLQRAEQTERFEKLGAGMAKAGDMAAKGFETAGQLVQLFGEDSEKVARKLFAVNKAAALVDIALKTGQAIMANLALGPFGVPLAIGAGITGAVQFALAASQQFGGASVPSASGAGSGGGAIGAAGGGGATASAASIPRIPDVSKGPGASDSAMFRGGARQGTFYRHKVIDEVAADGRYPGGAFDNGGGAFQRRFSNG